MAAGETIPKGAFIMQYVGEIFKTDSDIGAQRVQKYRKSTCTYLMRIDNNEVIDPTNAGNIARFINHSCDPNCQTTKWQVNGEIQVGIFALKEISEDEELTFNYQFDFFKTLLNKCYCGAKSCRGFLGVATGNSSSEDDEEAAAASDGSDSSVAFEPNPNELPICSSCKRAIKETKKMIVCTGCHQFFHHACALKRLSKKQPDVNPDALLRKRKFTCKGCFRTSQGRKKPGRKKDSQLQSQDPEA